MIEVTTNYITGSVNLTPDDSYNNTINYHCQ